MKLNYLTALVIFSFFACNKNPEKNSMKLPLVGTWKLQQATIIENGDTTINDYTKGMSFIKIINDSHFAFLSHNIPSKADTSNIYSAGGGKYTLVNNVYTEQLEYCSDRPWEGHNFQFEIAINGDTLTQTGIEKVENAGVNRLNIEKYLRVK